MSENNDYGIAPAAAILPSLKQKVYVWDNHGEELLWETEVAATSFVVTSDGVWNDVSAEWLYGYSGTGTFLGLSTSPSTTKPTYGINSTINLSSAGTKFYMVEAESTPVGSPIDVRYKNSKVTIQPGQTAFFTCHGKIMIDDIVIEKK